MQTIWITSNGEIIECKANSHYSYIMENFKKLFGKECTNQGEIHDYPYNSGWVHIQNHLREFNVRGNANALKMHNSTIRNLIFDKLMENREFTVNIEDNNKAKVNPHGYVKSFKIPEDFNSLKQILS